MCLRIHSRAGTKQLEKPSRLPARKDGAQELTFYGCFTRSIDVFRRRLLCDRSRLPSRRFGDSVTDDFVGLAATGGAEEEQTREPNPAEQSRTPARSFSGRGTGVADLLPTTTRKSWIYQRDTISNLAAQTASGGFSGRAVFAGGDVSQGAADHSGPGIPQRPGIKGGPAHDYRPVVRRKYTEWMPRLALLAAGALVNTLRIDSSTARPADQVPRPPKASRGTADMIAWQ